MRVRRLTHTPHKGVDPWGLCEAAVVVWLVGALVVALLICAVHYMRAGASFRDDWWVFALFSFVALAFVLRRSW